MNFQYHLYNRTGDLKKLSADFEDVVRTKGNIAYLVRGRNGIGKTRLIEEFFGKIDNDLNILSDISEFKRDKNIISFVCEKNKVTPYQSFIQITKAILRQRKVINIGIKAAQVILAVFGINDTLNALQDLADTVTEEKNKDKLQKKEIQLFNQYRNFIKKISSNSPLIIFIQHVQWIDIYSLKLIRKLISEGNQFWGMLILEQDESEMSPEISEEFGLVVSQRNLKIGDLYALDKSFPAKMLEDRFGKDFFNSEENDLLFTISEGTPGLLIDFIENTCISNKYLYEEKGVWKKNQNFLDSIKPVNQKLHELIISLYEDKEFAESELRLIKKMSRLWGISDTDVNQTVEMVKDIMDNGFRINQVLSSGIIGNSSFSVTDSSNRRYIIEYFKISGQELPIEYKQKGLENIHLLEAVSVLKCHYGILVIWDYFDGIKSREFTIREFEGHVRNNVEKFTQISEGLAELHRNQIVHGFVNPGAIIETNDGKFRIASLDKEILQLLTDGSENADTNDNHYVSPEVLKGAHPTFASDVFSLGVMFYKSLTNLFPFKGSTPEELCEAIKTGRIDFVSKHGLTIPAAIGEIIHKSTAYHLNERFGNAVEFYERIRGIDVTPVRDTAEKVPVTSRKKLRTRGKHSIYYLFILFLIILLGFGFWPHIRMILQGNATAIHREITVSVETVNKSDDPGKMVQAEVLAYIIAYNISSACNEIVLTRDQFNRYYAIQGEKHLPGKSIECLFKFYPIDNELKFKITDHSLKKEESEVISFRSPSELLWGSLDPLINKVCGNFNDRKGGLTRNWDAFISFYEGEKEWNRLDKNEAKRLMKKSIAADPQFLLPKLRLAGIYRFEGNNSTAIELMREIRKEENRLGTIDGLKSKALWNVLNGDNREAIDVYIELTSKQPTQKEPFYDLAEAYFELRDISNAKKNYQWALQIDSGYTLALNHLGYCYSHTGDHQNALKYFKKYVALDATANAYDSYGDGFYTAGYLDSARWAKQKGLELDPGLDYLYSSLSYINIREGKFEEAEENINRYLALQTEPELFSNGLTSKAFIYYSKNEWQKSLDTCLRAKSVFDSQNLVSRNHLLHWLLAKSAFELGKPDQLRNEMENMKQIIDEYRISEFHYNEIYKFYNDLFINDLVKKGNTGNAMEILSLFDGEMYSKIKDWSSPFDIAYFNGEFGKLFLRNKDYPSALIRLNKALEYNPNYALAHYYLAECYKRLNQPEKGKQHIEKFYQLSNNGDQDFPAILNAGLK